MGHHTELLTAAKTSSHLATHGRVTVCPASDQTAWEATEGEGGHIAHLPCDLAAAHRIPGWRPFGGRTRKASSTWASAPTAVPSPAPSGRPWSCVGGSPRPRTGGSPLPAGEFGLGPGEAARAEAHDAARALPGGDHRKAGGPDASRRFPLLEHGGLVVLCKGNVKGRHRRRAAAGTLVPVRWVVAMAVG
jgi:hypothetical protein